ncbi:hypothetical protein ABBQ38_014267 [Trebouxia sp. C0009 RCD-2024]
MTAFQDEGRTSGIFSLKATPAMPRAYTHLLPPEETAQAYAARPVVQQQLKALLEYAATRQQHQAQAAAAAAAAAAAPHAHAHVRGMEQLLDSADGQSRLSASDNQKPPPSSLKQHAPVTRRVSDVWFSYAAIAIAVGAQHLW